LSICSEKNSFALKNEFAFLHEQTSHTHKPFLSFNPSPLSLQKKVGSQLGVVKGDESDEMAKARVYGLQKNVTNLKTSLSRYYTAFSNRGAATSALYSSIGELYPGEQPFTANIASLVENSAPLKDTEEVELMKTTMEQALKEVDGKLATLAKMIQDRINFRIDIASHKNDIANFEKQGAPASGKVDQSKAKLTVSEAGFKEVDTALVPELDRLDNDLANMTSSAFKEFVEIQIKYNEKLESIYNTALSTISAPAPAAAAPVVAEAPAPATAPAPAPVVVAAPAPAPVVAAPAPAPVVVEAPAPAPVVVEAPAPAPVVVEAPAPAVEETAAPAVVAETADVPPAAPVESS